MKIKIKKVNIANIIKENTKKNKTAARRSFFVVSRWKIYQKIG